MIGNRQKRAGLDVATPLIEFVEEACVEHAISPDEFWKGVAAIIEELTPRNRVLLAKRDQMQDRLDRYHRAHPGQPDPADYRRLLEEIGYLEPEPAEFQIRSHNVDDEIAHTPGPQLVVPLLNARFAINAANARWGSLYDALYGTNAIPEVGDLARGRDYNVARGREVVSLGRDALDLAAPLVGASHHDAAAYGVDGGHLVVTVIDGSRAVLADPLAFVGYQGDVDQPNAIILRHHGLHIQVRIDRGGTVGSNDAAGVDDLILEAATTTIMDLEDSVAAVDADDKTLGYRNWRDLMRGTLQVEVEKGGDTFVRSMNDDVAYWAPDGTRASLPGRSLLLVRNVGHLMTTDAVRDQNGDEVFEGLLDAIMTGLGSLSDLRGTHPRRNSRTDSMYIVKPKMHGPAEVRFAVDLFSRVEQLLALPENTLKIGIMDEERRTTVNLRACIAEAADRIVFINTGFLDRTGDEIHTSLYAGPMVPKSWMRSQTYMSAYERANVSAGLRAGFLGHAQIGKGMWAMPDLMKEMLEQKGAHPRSGATTAWVPSPTAATLHALHYHQTDVVTVASALTDAPAPDVSEILVLPLLDTPLDQGVIMSELNNNVQSILGYVVRWIDQGIGCSKVPDIEGVALMEDRATLRISSQLLANWLEHGLITVDDVDRSLGTLAPIVDEQNRDDPGYVSLLNGGPGLAYESARQLILEGARQPNGYTEPILHDMRKLAKLRRGSTAL